MAGSTTIGTGAVILTANAEQLLFGLQKASKATENFAKKLSADATKSRDAFSDAFRGGLIGGAVSEGVKKLFNNSIDGLIEMVNHARAFRLEMERAASLNTEVGKISDRAVRRGEESISLSNSPGDKFRATGGESERISKELAGKKQQLKDLRSQVLALSDIWSSPNNFQLWIGGGRERQLEAVTAELKAMEDNVTSLNDRLRDVNEQRRRLGNPQQDPQLISDIDALTKAYEFQAATVGKTAEDIAILNFQMNRRASGPQLTALLKSIEKFNAAKLEGDLKDVTREWERQAETIGMTAEQAKLFELQMSGAFKLTAENNQNFAKAAEALKKLELKKLASDAEELAKSWELQADTLRMTTEEAKIFELEVVKGLNGDALDRLKETFANLNTAKLRKEIDDLAESWKVQAATVGMTADEIEIFKLKAKGATDEQLRELTALQKTRADAIRETKLGGAALFGSNEAESIATKFAAGNMLVGKSGPDDPKELAKQQLKEQKSTNQKLAQLVTISRQGTLVNAAEPLKVIAY